MKKILKKAFAVLIMGALVTSSAFVTVNADENVGKEVTTKQVEMKVGEAWAVNTEHIDALFKEAGYDYKSEYSRIFHSENLKMDTNLLTPACGVGVHDNNTQKMVDFLYVADAEWPELMIKYTDGTLAKKYGCDVMLVEEAEGFCYYARADKAGKTTITIPEYKLSNGEVITVNVPVNIINPTITVEKKAAAKGSVIKDKNGNKYKVTKSSVKNGTVTYVSPKNKKITSIKIADTVKVDGITYKITAISKNAFSGCKKLKKVAIGKNIAAINSKAFYKCSSLSTIVINTKLLKIGNVGKDAFKGIKNNATIKVPKSKQKAYKTILLKKGVNKKSKFKNI